SVHDVSRNESISRCRTASQPPRSSLMRGSATLTTVESMNATSEPRIADASVSRFCATVTDRQPNLREDLSGPDADLSLHCHLKGLRLQRLPVTTLLLIPLDDTVVFPTMDVTLPVDV